MNDLPELLTPKQVADFLMLDVTTVYKYLKRGLIEHFRVGQKKIMIPRQAVYNFINLNNGGNENE
ncbi:MULTISPECIES: helix-turn-helix domain-containing protein [Ureibacillus]|jgi:excisionase family DNA binding protein|uniref:Excisionase family DNA binding protein n=1 Tax=Ureibacillus thermosphaericus TaxID=51173 RepID=A0A840PWJ4_URETH|nr:helix-turn-helix domain-containing protein [Ureibacillus thermosphaericus]MBB5150273.1 excisionase family DNA binding protein [Ureibacillus thermosphaericus]NKZ32884.1 helix-turn-helix domain-containing protein [Ureibacillus thermosphaericus]